MLALLIVVGLARPARAEPKALTAGLLIAAEVSLAVDMLQTIDVQNRWVRTETNPLLGPHPDTGRIVGYFSAAMVVTAIGTYALPERWRLLVPLAVLAVEVPTIGRNLSIGYGFPF